MSRELKRVPLDFSWPLNKVWKGYIMPDSLDLPPCPDCKDGRYSDGYSVEARAIANTFYAHQIGGRDAEKLAWHDKIGQAEVDYLLSKGRLRVWRKRTPTPDDPSETGPVAEPVSAAVVNDANRRGSIFSDYNHDAINRMYLVEFRCAQLGISLKCRTCDGKGEVATEDQRKAYDEWEKSEPPTGEGYQVWETVSEGSPISPVFKTSEELVSWLVREGYTRAAAEAFIKSEWAPSMIMTGGKLYRDIEALGGVE